MDMNRVKTLLWAEWRKLRRSKIIWISVFAVALASATVIAQGQFVLALGTVLAGLPLIGG